MPVERRELLPHLHRLPRALLDDHLFHANVLAASLGMLQALFAEGALPGRIRHAHDLLTPPVGLAAASAEESADLVMDARLSLRLGPPRFFGEDHDSVRAAILALGRGLLEACAGVVGWAPRPPSERPSWSDDTGEPEMPEGPFDQLVVAARERASAYRRVKAGRLVTWLRFETRAMFRAMVEQAGGRVLGAPAGLLLSRNKDGIMSLVSAAPGGPLADEGDASGAARPAPRRRGKPASDAPPEIPRRRDARATDVRVAAFLAGNPDFSGTMEEMARACGCTTRTLERSPIYTAWREGGGGRRRGRRGGRRLADDGDGQAYGAWRRGEMGRRHSTS